MILSKMTMVEMRGIHLSDAAYSQISNKMPVPTEATSRRWIVLECNPLSTPHVAMTATSLQ